MTPDHLDRILAAEEPLVPSSGFAVAVMEQVRTAAAAPPPLPFPWRPFLLGIALVTALAGLCVRIAATLPTVVLRTALGGTLGALTDPRLALALGGPLAALAGTYLLVRLTLGFTGARR